MIYKAPKSQKESGRIKRIRSRVYVKGKGCQFV